MTNYRRPRAAGWLARSKTNQLGVGKVVAETTDRLTIEYFHSASRQETHEVGRNELHAVRLAKQTRCYVYDEDQHRWSMGRIGERDGHEYEINLPDRESLWLPESCVYVRSSLAVEDPVETLVLKGHETAHFHARRFRLVKALIRQRAASQGMTGLTSARIEIFAHQVEVVRRVLEDPVQRYLLADEVGLGKTIEAGVLIRQFLLDVPREAVLVAVPPLLVQQWKNELELRFDAFRDGRVHVLATTEIGEIPERARFGMLVVDEAHHLGLGMASVGGVPGAVFETVRRLAQRSQRVVLLSATPAINHETEFLAMLHLLDPKTYPLDEIDAFRERIRLRQDIGRVLLTLTEDARSFSLKLSLKRLLELFPRDERLVDLAARLTSVLETIPSDASTIADIVRAARTHLSETYRLHRRMLRTRRAAMSDAILARATQRVVVSFDDSDESVRIDDLIDEWRTIAAQASQDSAWLADGDALAQNSLVELFLILCQTADGSFSLLEAVIKWRLEADPDARDRLTTELSQTTVALIRDTPPLPGEAAILNQLLETLSSPVVDRRIQAVVEVVQRVRATAGATTPARCVVFTAFTTTALSLAARLAKVFGQRCVAQHVSGMAPDVIETEIKRFASSYDCFVLVCDSSAEEGRNLQFAEHLIHFDLPWHPNRLEQRIGRVDRISRTRDLTTHILLARSDDNGIHRAWFRMLDEGFGLFKNSIAGLQFYVDAKLPELHECAFFNGVSGLVNAITTIQSEIQREQEKIDEQTAIDEIDTQGENAVQFVDALDESDAAYEKWQADVEGWLCGVLGFVRENGAQTPRTQRYRADSRTLVPEDVLAARFRPFLNRPGTYDRAVAARNPSVALYRVGEGLIDALANYILWDDRGQAFALWRVDRSWDSQEGAEWVGFRFNVVIEADKTAARHVLRSRLGAGASMSALDRRADALFPPHAETVFIDTAFEPVTDPRILQLLSRSFLKETGPDGVDYNLTKDRVAIIDSIVAPERWPTLCRDARDAAVRLVRDRADIRARCFSCAERAERKGSLVQEQLRIRALAGVAPSSGEGTVLDMDIERELSEALVVGIRAPVVRIDSVGLIILSGRAPSGCHVRPERHAGNA